MPETEIDDDVAMILDAHFLAAELIKTRWEGQAENLVLRPGLVFELGHCYGRRDSGAIMGLVTAASLLVRTAWPSDLAAPPDAEAGEAVTVRAACIDFGRDSAKRFVAGTDAQNGAWRRRA
jgi:hypothetical protein